MPRQLVDIGPDHRPWQAGVGDPARQFGIDEVANPRLRTEPKSKLAKRMKKKEVAA